MRSNFLSSACATGKFSDLGNIHFSDSICIRKLNMAQLHRFHSALNSINVSSLHANRSSHFIVLPHWPQFFFRASLITCLIQGQTSLQVALHLRSPPQTRVANDHYRTFVLAYQFGL